MCPREWKEIEKVRWSVREVTQSILESVISFDRVYQRRAHQSDAQSIYLNIYAIK